MIMKYQVGDVISIIYKINDDYLYFGVITEISRFIYVNRFSLKLINSKKIIKHNNVLVFDKIITPFNIKSLNKHSNLYKLLKLESTLIKLMDS